MNRHAAKRNAAAVDGKRPTGRVSAFLLPILGLVLLVAIWWGAKVTFDIRTLFMPSPAEVVNAFVIQPEYILAHTWYTVKITLIGFGLAVGVGMFLAVLLASSAALERMFYPLLVALNAVPKVALAPILTVWLGFDMQPKIWMVVLVCFFPVVVSTTFGLVSTPAEFIEYTKSLDAPRWRTFVKVRFPYALPQIFVGLKVGITLAVIGAVVGEMAGGSDGLGFVIVTAMSNSDTSTSFASLVLLGAIAVALFYLIVTLERVLLPWAKETTTAR